MAALMTKKRIVFLTLSVALMIVLLAGAVFGQASQKSNLYRYLSTFSEVFELVRSNYVDQVSSEQLMDGAFSGVTDAIDEFSYYVPPAQMAQYKNFTDIDDNGVGLVVTKRFGYAFVVSPIPGSPAAKAGIERGDFIEKIDGHPTQKLAVWQVRNLLRTGKPIKLQVLRGGQTKRDEFTIQSAPFHPLAVTSETINGIAYIKLPYFEKNTAEEFRAALEDVRKRGIRKLIIDLRGNAAGSVEEAIASVDDLLTGGMITAIEGRQLQAKKWQADRETAFDGEVQVLTDTSTAAGAEVFAAAIHGNNRGKLVGVTTYGKAIEQKFIQLPSGGGVQMTIAHYTTPDLKPIKETGIRPDVIVDLTSQAIVDPKDSKAKTQKEDLILNRALQLFGAAPAGEKKAA
jgi:carboxyl-terminal processing protease